MQTNIAKHPPSLRTFFATELWERYGFYVIQTLLALYLSLHHQWPDARVYTLVGSFTALTYLSPMVGGWVADRLLGQKRSVLVGAIILCLSYLLMGLELDSDHLTWMLAGIAVGTGLLKPNISSLLGNEYTQGSPHRESGFTIFYMGITTGIILGTTLPSYLNDHFGWSSTFLSAAFGLLIATATFSFGIYRYKIADYTPYKHNWHEVLLAVLLIGGLFWASHEVLESSRLANAIFATVVLLSIAYIILSIRNETKKQAKKTLVIGFLCIISIFFWAFYFQMFLSLTLFISRVVEPKLWGIPFPPPYYVAVQSIGMIIFGTFFALRKQAHCQSERGIQIGNKFLLAMFFMAVSYSMITLMCGFHLNNALLSPLYFLPTYLLISVAELLLSPVGLSAVTLLSSQNKVSTMMGIFFVSLGVGSFMAGKLANLTAIQTADVSILSLKFHYFQSFRLLTVVLFAATLLCVVLNRKISALMREES